MNYSLLKIENTLKEVCHDDNELDTLIRIKDMSGKEITLVKTLLEERKHILDGMFLCTPAEIERLRVVNDRLFDLTKKLYAKTYDLYTSILRDGLDPDFDDDIMVEGTLRYDCDFFDDEGESVIEMEEDAEYESDFRWMMALISEIGGKRSILDTRCCAQTFASYKAWHTPYMTPLELGLENTLDDGTSWDHGGRFKDICLCHAAYSLTSDDFFSWPDLLRMNDFWCEIKIIHQHIVDSQGNRWRAFDTL